MKHLLSIILAPVLAATSTPAAATTTPATSTPVVVVATSTPTLPATSTPTTTPTTPTPPETDEEEPTLPPPEQDEDPVPTPEPEEEDEPTTPVSPRDEASTTTATTTPPLNPFNIIGSILGGGTGGLYGSSASLSPETTRGLLQLAVGLGVVGFLLVEQTRLRRIGQWLASLFRSREKQQRISVEHL